MNNLTSIARTDKSSKAETNGLEFSNKVDIIERVLNNEIETKKEAFKEDDKSTSINTSNSALNVSTDDQIQSISKSFLKKDKMSFFIKPQRWIGHIYEINQTSFFGKINDLNNPTTQEIVEIDLTDVSYDDKELIGLGAGFYLSVGHASDENGQVEKKSLLRFQRTKPWDNDDFNNIMSSVDSLLDKFNDWE
jgi:hypothetical protein